MSIATQRWLSVRLDFLGALLLFAVAILAVAARYSISSAETGVIIAYTFTAQQAFGWMIRYLFVERFTSPSNRVLTFHHRHSAEIENNMNAVERLLYYANNIDQEREIEGNGSVPEKRPQRGEIEFTGVKMSHRPGLPLALKGVDLKIKEGEHVGIIGRTGAGKSSIIAALFRMAELESGTITIDGVDTSKVPLQNLRDGLSSTFFEFTQLWSFSFYFHSHSTRSTPLQRNNTE